MHSDNKVNTRYKTCLTLWYDLLKSIFTTVRVIRSSSYHAGFSWVYNNYKTFLSVETDDILLATENRFFLKD